MKKHTWTVLCFAGILAVSCTTVDVQDSVKTSKKTGKQASPQAENSMVITIPIDTEPVIIEKPVYIPQGSPGQASPQGRTAVEQANRQGIVQPQDYSHAAMVYDYSRDFVYEIYCRPLRITDVYLKPGERVVEPPFVADSDRWMIGAGVSYENEIPVQHIYIKPTAANLEASLIINTNERVYHLILRSFAAVHMPMVRWKYPGMAAMPQQYIKTPGKPSFASGTAATDTDEDVTHDPRFISFNYRITYGLFKKPRWLPTLVYDDGSKTYITFPETVLQDELPAVFENRENIVNYRVAQNVMIIDKLVAKITIKLDKYVVTVEKKKGSK